MSESNHTNYHLAQVNIGRILDNLDSPTMQGFVSQLDEINALADSYQGFVWRLQDDDGAATSYRPTDDDMLLINMSVWESIEALFDYTYKSDHVKVMRDRKKWFEHMTEAYMVLWWIPVGHKPTMQEAFEKLAVLKANGPTQDAFTFKDNFPPPVNR